MRLFETIKETVTVGQAAEYYGMKIGRNNMICCPFHNDHYPSMKLNTTYYYCFGCGATGDVIQFVANLFGLSNYEAAKKIAVDFGITPDNPPVIATLKKPEYMETKSRQKELHECQKMVCEYLHRLGKNGKHCMHQNDRIYLWTNDLKKHVKIWVISNIWQII